MPLFRRSEDRGSDRWVVAGLGNPGDRYAGTRHNAGVLVVEELLGRTSSSFKRHKSGCLIAEAKLEGEPVVLARTTSYMNESGRPLRELMRWYKAPPERLIVVHDELDIPFGEVRIKVSGGTAGHNGLRSLVSHLGKDFVKVRIGIGRPRGNTRAEAYVLEEFSGAERKQLSDILETAADAVESIVAHGVERAMNEVNTRE